MDKKKIVGYTLTIGGFITAIFGCIAMRKAFDAEAKAIKVSEEEWAKAWYDLGVKHSQ